MLPFLVVFECLETEEAFSVLAIAISGIASERCLVMLFLHMGLVVARFREESIIFFITSIPFHDRTVIRERFPAVLIAVLVGTRVLPAPFDSLEPRSDEQY